MQCPPAYRPGGPCAAPQGAPSATQQCRRLVHARKGLHSLHLLGEERVVVDRTIVELDLFLRAQASASARRRTGQHISTTAAKRSCSLECAQTQGLMELHAGAQTLGELARLAGRMHVVVCERVLHPVLVVALREILARVRAARLSALLRTVDGHRTVDQQVLQLKRLRTARKSP